MRSILAGRHPVAILAPKWEGGRGDVRKRERRMIALVASLMPTAAWSQSCADVRPGWEPGTQVTAWSEAIQLFSMPPSLVLLVASAIVIRTRSQWGALAVVVFWTGLVALVTFTSERLYGSLTIAEGCIGSPALFIAAVTAICTAMILYTLPRETRL